MNLSSRIAVAGALALASAAVNAESTLHTAIAIVADDQGGRSQDLDFAFGPSPWWSLDAGVGSTETDPSMGSIDGTSVRAGMNVRSERFGLRGYYRNYSDSSDFENETVGARVSMRHASFTWSLIAEARTSHVVYVVRSAERQTEQTEQINAQGYGLGLTYSARAWGLYAEGVFYDSQSPDPHEATGHMPTLLGIPLAPPTGNSLVFKHGVLDHQLSAGIERSFMRSSVRLDWIGVEDAISGAQSDTLSAAYKHAISSNVQVGLMAGVTNSTLGSAKFAGASFLWSL